MSSFFDEIAAKLAGLSGIASPEVSRDELNEFNVRDIQAVRVSEGGGGGSPPQVRPFPFAFDNTDIDTGVDTGIVIPAGAYVPADAIGVYVADSFDGTTPTGGAGFSAEQAQAGVLVKNPMTANSQRITGTSGVVTVQNASATDMYATTGGTVWFSVTDGAGAFAVCVPFGVASLPATILPGVNDTFVYTGGGGMGSPETFTLPAGVYTTGPDMRDAMAAATGSVSSERFDTKALPYWLQGDQLALEALAIGAGANGDTITEGNGGAAALGFGGNPDIFSSGGDPGAAGSTVGSGVLLVTYWA